MCFEDLSKTLHKEYKEEINKETKNNIENKLVKNIKDEEKIFIKDLSAALRRFISRYLSGKGQVNDINENTSLEYQLIRVDLWEEKYGKLKNLDELIHDKMKDFNIKVGRHFPFIK